MKFQVCELWSTNELIGKSTLAYFEIDTELELSYLYTRIAKLELKPLFTVYQNEKYFLLVWQPFYSLRGIAIFKCNWAGH